MNYEYLKQLAESGVTIRIIAKTYKISTTSVRYWLKKFQLKTKRTWSRGKPLCKKCNESDPIKFYKGKSRICRTCDNDSKSERHREVMKKVRAYFGNKCLICSFDRYQSSLALHHIDPKTKKAEAKQFRNWSWFKILKEIKKCALICNNCHGAIHSGELTFDFSAYLGR